MNADPRRLAALVVNYDSGPFAARCVESLVREWEREDRDPRRLDVVVIDNASPRDQEPYLRRVEAAGATVIRSRENHGYAGGINRCFERTQGGPDDVVAVLNPDLCFLPGNLATLMGYLAEHPECGVVAPRATIDPDFRLGLPKNALPTLLEEVRVLATQISPRLCRAYSRRRLRYSLPWWAAEEPLVTDMLSGCCLFLRRGVALELGQVMDERFPLYYEDTDLFRELDERGYTIVQHVGTTVLHHWSRSSGFGEAFLGEPMRRFRLSRAAYFRKYYGPLGAAFVALVDRIAECWPSRFSHRPMHPLTSFGLVAEPPELRFGRSASYVIEIAMRPNWQLAVGVLGEGDRWVCPPETWQWFFDCDYFLRALERDTGRLLGAWHLRKTTPGRAEPLTEAEVEALRTRRPERRHAS